MQSIYVLLFSSLAFVVHAGDQTVGVRGTLLCGDKPLVGAEVKLWELDIYPNPDDLLASVETDSNGRFELYGTEDDWPSITPVVKFYHRCNNKMIFDTVPKPCKRKNVFEIPSKYINKGKNVNKWYEMGTINLEAKLKGEGTECI